MAEIRVRKRPTADADYVSDDNPFPVEVKSPPKEILPSSQQGVGAIALSSIIRGRPFLLREVRCRFSSAPTTSENFTVTLDSGINSNYDTVLLSTNPSTTAATSIHWIPEEKIFVMPGDQVDIAYTNTDARTFGCELILEEY